MHRPWVGGKPSRHESESRPNGRVSNLVWPVPRPHISINLQGRDEASGELRKLLQCERRLSVVCAGGGVRQCRDSEKPCTYPLA